MTNKLSMMTGVRPALLALALIGAACGPFRRGAALDEQTLVFFSNESSEQAAVYAVVSAGEGARIGTVFAGQTDTLVVPATMVGRGSVNIVARMLARSEAPRTGPIAMHAGQRWQVTLPSSLRTLFVLPAQ